MTASIRSCKKGTETSQQTRPRCTNLACQTNNQFFNQNRKDRAWKKSRSARYSKISLKMTKLWANSSTLSRRTTSSQTISQHLSRLICFQVAPKAPTLRTPTLEHNQSQPWLRTTVKTVWWRTISSTSPNLRTTLESLQTLPSVTKQPQPLVSTWITGSLWCKA